MLKKILKTPGFQSLLSKLIILYIVYVRKFTIIGLLSISSSMSSDAIMAGDIAILAFIMDYLIINFFKNYVRIYVLMKNIKTGENTSIFYRDMEDIQKVILSVTVKCKNRGILRMIKTLLSKDKIILKLKWSHDSWLSFQRVDSILTMNKNTLFYADTDALCIDLFSPLTEEELYAEIINTPLLMSCDMGDKSEGQITMAYAIESGSLIKRRLMDFLLSIWIDIEYMEHKVKVI